MAPIRPDSTSSSPCLTSPSSVSSDSSAGGSASSSTSSMSRTLAVRFDGISWSHPSSFFRRKHAPSTSPSTSTPPSPANSSETAASLLHQQRLARNIETRKRILNEDEEFKQKMQQSHLVKLRQARYQMLMQSLECIHQSPSLDMADCSTQKTCADSKLENSPGQVDDDEDGNHDNADHNNATPCPSADL